MKLLTKKVKILTIYENKFYFLSFLLEFTAVTIHLQQTSKCDYCDEL